LRSKNSGGDGGGRKLENFFLAHGGAIKKGVSREKKNPRTNVNKVGTLY